MFQPNQRVTVDLSGLVIQGVTFSQNVQRALGTIVVQLPTPLSQWEQEINNDKGCVMHDSNNGQRRRVTLNLPRFTK